MSVQPATTDELRTGISTTGVPLSSSKLQAIRREITNQVEDPELYLLIEREYRQGDLPDEALRLNIPHLATQVELQRGEFDAGAISSEFVDEVRSNYPQLLGQAEERQLPENPTTNNF